MKGGGGAKSMDLGYFEILHVTQKCKNSLTLIFCFEIRMTLGPSIFWIEILHAPESVKILGPSYFEMKFV